MEPSPELPPPSNSPRTAPPQPAAPAGSAAIPVVRRYPKPPPLLTRFVMLCLRPETWPEAARYPTYVTILPLLLAIMLGAAVMATADSIRFLGSLDSFAAHYDANGYPALLLHSDGTLSSTGPLPAPIRVELHGVFAPDPDMVILADPTGTTSPDTVKSLGYFITDKEVVTTGEGPRWNFKLPTVLSIYNINLPPEGKTTTLNSAALQTIITEHRPVLMAYGVFVGGLYAVIQLLWAILMMFILSPAIMIAAAGLPDAESPRKRLILPRRAAVRMAAGFLVPVVLIDSILRAGDVGVARVVGVQWSLVVWLLACAGLAIWTGIMANRLYMPRVQARRGH